MPLVEVDEGEVAAGREAVGMLKKMLTGKTRLAALKLVKELEPERAIPELDAATAAEAAVGATREADEAFRKEVRDQLAELKTGLEVDKTSRDVDQRIAQGRALLARQGWSEAEIPKIEARMTELGLTDYKAASLLYERENTPAPEPVAPAGPFGNLISPTGDASEEEGKLLMARQFKRFSDKRVADFLAEKRAGQLQF